MFDTTVYISLEVCKRVVNPILGEKLSPGTGHSVDNVLVISESDELKFGTKPVLF